MRVRTVARCALAGLVLVSVGLIRPVAAAGSIPLGDFALGDLIQMPKDCDGNNFAHVHVLDELNVELAEFPIDALVDPYVFDTATYGAGTFAVTIHCEPSADHHDPTNIDITYTFTVIAPVVASTTTEVLGTFGSPNTTSISLMATLTVLAGSALLLVRRRPLV